MQVELNIFQQEVPIYPGRPICIQNKLASLKAMLVRNSAHSLTDSLTGVWCRATSVAKKCLSLLMILICHISTLVVQQMTDCLFEFKGCILHLYLHLHLHFYFYLQFCLCLHSISFTKFPQPAEPQAADDCSF